MGAIRTDGPIAECHCPPERRHAHGTGRMYTTHKCRCCPCRSANSARARARNRLKAYGRYDNPRVDSSRAREHLEALSALGVHSKLAARKCGLSPTTIDSILGIGGRRLARTVFARTESKILALPLDPNEYHDRRFGVDRTGIVRRIQALAAIGYSMTRQCRISGLPYGTLTGIVYEGRSPTVAHRNVAAVLRMYEQCWDKPYQDNGTVGDKIARSRTIAMAKRRGWQPPMAWDDDTIDDPNAEPFIDETGGKRSSRGHIRIIDEGVLEDLDWLRRSGVLPQDAADRVGFPIKSLRNAVQYRGYAKNSPLAVWLRDEEHHPKGGGYHPRRKDVA